MTLTKKTTYRKLLGGQPVITQDADYASNHGVDLPKGCTAFIYREGGFFINMDGKYIIDIGNESFIANFLPEAEKILWEKWGKYNSDKLSQPTITNFEVVIGDGVDIRDKLAIAIKLLHEVSDAWDEKLVIEYPCDLPSFDELVSNMEGIMLRDNKGRI